MPSTSLDLSLFTAEKNQNMAINGLYKTINSENNLKQSIYAQTIRIGINRNFQSEQNINMSISTEK